MSIVLAKDENIIREDVFTTNLALFWLKADFNLTNKRVTGQKPNTLFGLIPLGKSEIVQPLKSITSVSSSTKFHIGRLFIGLLLLLVGVAIGSWVSLLIFCVLGLILLLNCYTAEFLILSNTAIPQGYEISILEKSKVESLVSQINTVVSEL